MPRGDVVADSHPIGLNEGSILVPFPNRSTRKVAPIASRIRKTLVRFSNGGETQIHIRELEKQANIMGDPPAHQNRNCRNKSPHAVTVQLFEGNESINTHGQDIRAIMQGSPRSYPRRSNSSPSHRNGGTPKHWSERHNIERSEYNINNIGDTMAGNMKGRGIKYNQSQCHDEVPDGFVECDDEYESDHSSSHKVRDATSPSNNKKAIDQICNLEPGGSAAENGQRMISNPGRIAIEPAKQEFHSDSKMDVSLLAENDGNRTSRKVRDPNMDQVRAMTPDHLNGACKSAAEIYNRRVQAFKLPPLEKLCSIKKILPLDEVMTLDDHIRKRRDITMKAASLRSIEEERIERSDRELRREKMRIRLEIMKQELFESRRRKNIGTKTRYVDRSLGITQKCNFAQNDRLRTGRDEKAERNVSNAHPYQHNGHAERYEVGNTQNDSCDNRRTGYSRKIGDIGNYGQADDLVSKFMNPERAERMRVANGSEGKRKDLREKFGSSHTQPQRESRQDDESVAARVRGYRRRDDDRRERRDLHAHGMVGVGSNSQWKFAQEDWGGKAQRGYDW